MIVSIVWQLLKSLQMTESINNSKISKGKADQMNKKNIKTYCLLYGFFLQK